MEVVFLRPENHCDFWWDFFPASELDLNLFYAINDLITKFTEMSHV